MRKKILYTLWLVLLTVHVCLFSGCASIPFFDRSYRYVQPTIAVLKFENNAPIPYKWNLGDGMCDLLVNRLAETKRFSVLEREDLLSVLQEIELQHSGITRPQERVARQRIKNANYLVKGVIRDFSHVATARGGIGYKWYKIGGKGSVAVVSMIVTVIEVESGEVILSKDVTERIYSGKIDFAGVYENVAFGGEIFYTTPLGKSTKRAMEKAVKYIVKSIGKTRWHPVVSGLSNDLVVVNGGRDRRVRIGTQYSVIEAGDEVFDPLTGNSLGRAPGKRIGVLEIVTIFDKFAYARLLEGSPGEVGYRLRRMKQ